MSNNIKILIVDDKYEKVKALINLMEGTVGSDEFEHVTNTRDALKKVKDHTFDLLIIDLQIPEALGDDINIHGGQKLLEYIEENSELKKPTHILGLTEHKDSYEICESAFKTRGWSLILGLEDTELIKSIITSKIQHSIDPPINYDVAIITALEKTELEAVLNLPCDWIPVKDQNDCNIYYSGKLESSSGKLITIIATSCHHMGLAQATAVSMKMCLKFNPKYIIMTGIAAGIEGKVNLGDILVADPCWDWGSGKQTIKEGKPTFLSAPRQLPLTPLLKGKLKNIATKRQFMDDIFNEWVDKPNWPLNLHIGPVATGAAVLEDPSVIEMIQSQHRETIGVEMEAYGVALAAIMSSDSPPIPIIIKSVCDYANTEKNDSYQNYAAYTSAKFAIMFIKHELF